MLKINNLPNKKELNEYSKKFNQIFIEIKNKKQLHTIIKYFHAIGYCLNYETWKDHILKDSILSNVRSENPNDLKHVHYIWIDVSNKNIKTNFKVKIEFSDEDYNSLANEKILIIDAPYSQYTLKHFKKKLRI